MASIEFGHVNTLKRMLRSKERWEVESRCQSCASNAECERGVVFKPIGGSAVGDENRACSHSSLNQERNDLGYKEEGGHRCNVEGERRLLRPQRVMVSGRRGQTCARTRGTAWHRGFTQ
jgi:hypothetical protein